MLFRKINVLLVMCFLISIAFGNIVEELRQRFNYVTDECVDTQNNTHPAFKCSGLLMRGIELKEGMKFAWSLKPSNKKQNSFSFTYIRRDHTFTNIMMDYDAGFILYPHLKTPPHKLPAKVLCSFPANAWTDGRDDHGCGRFHSDETGSSEPCHTQNITTASQWMGHYNSINMTEYWMCGFKMTKETGTKDFTVALQANAILQNEKKAGWTEDRVEAWNEDDAKSIPIQAFFYTIGRQNGSENAVKYRDEFYAQSGGETVPIVGIKFPTDEDPNVEITGDKVSS